MLSGHNDEQDSAPKSVFTEANYFAPKDKIFF